MIPITHGPFTKLATVPRRAVSPGELFVLQNCHISGNAGVMHHGWKKLGVNPVDSVTTWNEISTLWNAATGTWQNQGTTGGTIRHAQWHVLPSGAKFICIHTDTAFVVYDPLTAIFTDYTPAAPYTSDKTWSSCSYGNLYVFTNGVDNVQKWDGSGTPGVATDLGGTPSDCIIVRTIGPYLMLIGCTSDYRLIKWSSSTNPENFATGDSGNLTVYDGEGIIIGAEVLGYDSLIVYKSNSIHHYVMSGYPYYFVQQTRILGFGAGGPNCIANAGGMHVVMSKGGLFKYDGVQAVLFDEESTRLFKDIASGETISYAVVRYDYAGLRILVLTPDQVNLGVLNKLFIYSIPDKSWSSHTVETTIGCIGAMPKQQDTWNTSTVTWDGLREAWDSNITVGTERLILSDLEGYLEVEDKGTYTKAGVAYSGVIETGFILPSLELFQQPHLNCELMQIDVGLLTGNPSVQIGTSNFGDEQITWTAPYSLVNGIVYCSVVGRYFTIRFSSSTPFALLGFSAYFVQRGIL